MASEFTITRKHSSDHNESDVVTLYTEADVREYLMIEEGIWVDSVTGNASSKRSYVRDEATGKQRLYKLEITITPETLEPWTITYVVYRETLFEDAVVDFPIRSTCRY